MNLMTLSVSYTACVCWGLVVCDIADLTHPLQTNRTWYWPSNKEFEMTNEFRGEKIKGNGEVMWYESEDYGAASHGGTHMDAPSHMGRGGWTVDEVPADKLFGPLVLINIVDRLADNRNYQVQVIDIERHEQLRGRIPDRAIVIMKSGWSKYWPDKANFLGTADGNVSKLSFPGFSLEAARWLLTERSINGLGVDTPSLDPGDSQDFGVHLAAFAENKFGLENVALTDLVPERGALVIALPMKNTGASGAPCRIVAVWGNELYVLNNSTSWNTTLLFVLLSGLITLIIRNIL